MPPQGDPQEALVKIHEYQAKEILRKFGVAIPRGHLATTPLQAEGPHGSWAAASAR